MHAPPVATTGMATITKNGLTIMALLASLYILETGRFIPVGVGRGRVEPEGHRERLDRHRDKRNAAAQQQWDYTIHLTINTYNISLLASFLNTAQLPIQLDNHTQISAINISTQCYPHSSGFQCRCGDGFAWPHSSCLQYGSCDVGSLGLCQCINAIPADGQSCVPIAELPHFEYQVEVELNVTDVAALEDVKELLGSSSLPLSVRPHVSLTSVEVTTVCFPSAGAFQCQCEDGFSWSGQQCAALGACDGTSAGGAPCQCINNIPPDGPFCQPSMANYQYLISVELFVDDVDVLREVLTNISFPVVTQALTVSDLNISTVCSPSAGGFRCRCEDQYVWPCADCLQYGACDNQGHGLCSCIHAIPPDGRHCLPLHHGSLPCPSSTEAPPSTAPPLLHQYVLSVEVRVPEVSGVNQLRGILGNLSYPISIGNNTQISEVNITTVCEELSGELQCRCEGQLRWRCELCGALGSCDLIGGGGGDCGCLSGRPPSGEQCQPPESLSTCPFPITTTDPSVAAANQLFRDISATTTKITPLPDSSPFTTAAPTATTIPAVTDTSAVGTTDLSTGLSTSATDSSPVATRVSNGTTAATMAAISDTSAVGTTDLHTNSSTSTTDSSAVTTAALTATTIPAIADTSAVGTTDLSTDLSTSATDLSPVATTISNGTTAATTAAISDTSAVVTTDLHTNSSTSTTDWSPVTTAAPTATTIPAIADTSAVGTTDLSTDLSTSATDLPPVATTISNGTTAATTAAISDTSAVGTTDLHTNSSTSTTDWSPVTTAAPTATTIPAIADTSAVGTTDLSTDLSTSATDLSPVAATISNGTTAATTAAVPDTSAVGTTDVNTNSSTSTTDPSPVTTAALIATTIPASTDTSAVGTTDLSTDLSTSASDSSSPVATTALNISAASTATATTEAFSDSPPVATTVLNGITAPTPTTTRQPISDSSPFTTAAPTASTISAITDGSPVTTAAPTATTIQAITDSSPVTSAVPTATTIPALTDTSAVGPTEPSTAAHSTPAASTGPYTSSAATTDLNTDTHTTPVPSTGPGATSVSPSNQTAATPTAVATTTESATPSTQATTLIASTSVSTTFVTMTSNTTTAGAASATGSTTVWTTEQTTTTTVTGPTTAATALVTATPSAPVASTTAVTTTHPTSSTTNSAAPGTSAVTSSTGLTATPSSTPFAGFSVEMSIRLEKDFTDDFNNPSSAEYMELERNVSKVLNEQYKVITGFVKVYVERFRRGSVLTDFVLNSRQVNAIELAAVNRQLPAAMEPVAKVIGSVTVLYNSKEPIGVPALTYTGSTMTLTCGPRSEDIDLGRVSGSVWRYRGREIPESNRIKVTTSDAGSKLTINDVIPQDAGRYTCILSANMTFIQEGNVREDNIKQAPNLQLQSRVNAQCRGALTQELKCCVQAQYKVQWFQETGVLLSFTVNIVENQTYCITHTYKLENCTDVPPAETFTCRVVSPDSYSNTTTLVIFTDDHTCDDSQFGIGRQGHVSEIACGKGQEGSKTAICEIVEGTGHWKLVEDTCILTAIKDLLIDSQDLVVEEVPALAQNLSQTVETQKENVTDSSQTISAIVEILNSIANVSTAVNDTVMENVLDTVDVIIANSAKDSWDFLNANETRNDSSLLLGALESLSDGLEGKVFIAKERIQLNRTPFNQSFVANLNSSVFIEIADSDLTNVFITTMMLSTFSNVMPARNSTFNISALDAAGGQTDGSNAINAATVLVKVTENIDVITLRYRKLDSSLTDDPQCVFWNFTLLDNLGAWDNKGCTFVSDRDNLVTCSCTHLTSFSILMATNVPPAIRVLLDVITYVGVGISMASLLICLVIEAYVWKAMTRNSTAFMRHVSIVNTALSLLIADICFIIGASYAKNPLENPGEDHRVPPGPCSTATFFMHFFYLAVFFWMLVSGLLLFYRTVMVFSHMSKSSMLAAGFTLGYGCPLLIAVITVAVTATQDGYIRTSEACWLNWSQTRALLAFVIPALTVVFINILIIAVVLFKMLRRGVGEMAQTDERHTLVVIARCVLILTPLFGLTWSLGVGTMVSSTNRGIHIAFAFFNSLQGFFILVFGTLWDSKIRSALSRKFQPTSSMGSNQTKSTGAGISSIGQLNFISRLRGRRYVYHLSEAANSSSSSSSGTSDTYANI